MAAQHLALPAYAQLSAADEAALTDLFRRGTPANTLRAWERDLAYIAAWKMASFGAPLTWPEEEKVALRFTALPCRPRNTMPMSRSRKIRRRICWASDASRFG